MVTARLKPKISPSLAKPIILLLAGLVFIGIVWKQQSIGAQDAKKQIEALEAERSMAAQDTKKRIEALEAERSVAANLRKDLKQMEDELLKMKDHLDRQTLKMMADAATFQEQMTTCHAVQSAMNKDRDVLVEEHSDMKEDLLMARGERYVDSWEIEELPIMKSISRGFHPVYVYSTPTLERSGETYAQAKQDVLVDALTKANHDKLEASNTTIVNTVEAMDMAYHSMDARPFFVDLVANEGIKNSNTYLLESNGWNGLCVEPDPQYWSGLASSRKCTIVGGGIDNGDGEVDGNPTDKKTGGIRGKGMDDHNVDGDNGDSGNVGVKGIDKRNLVSLFTVFKETNVPKVIDYLSLDAEGAKALVMDNFPWKDYTFKFLTVDSPDEDLTQALNSHGYEMVRKLSASGETLWIHNESVLLSKEEIDTVAQRSYPSRCLRALKYKC